MAEYIERKALLTAFCERCSEEMSDEPCEPSDCFARAVIKRCAAADVVEVVRCKDCLFYKCDNGYEREG